MIKKKRIRLFIIKMQLNRTFINRTFVTINTIDALTKTQILYS